MSSGRILSVASIVLALFANSCGGGGGGGGSSNSIVSVEQDLTVDPTGQTTVVTFAADPGALDITNFEADSGQVAQTVVQAGAEFTIEWDERVTPSHQVRALTVPGVSNAFTSVTTSDASVPSFVITSANQVAGLGLDTLSVQFSGPRVVESECEDLNNWTLQVSGTTLSLAGSSFSLDNTTQVLSITTGSLANLHANFTLAAKASLHSVADVALATTNIPGVATGDAVAPTLTSVEQNLAEDEFGRVVDLTFSEAMDPVFCAPLSNYGGTIPDVANGFSQPSENVLRISFNNPIVPGVNTIDLANLLDAHGNVFADQIVAVAAGSTVANSFDSGPDITTIEGEGGDVLVATFVQAIDPDDASDPTKWNLEVPTGNALDLTNCTFTYDLPTKALSIELDVDLQNGASFTFEGLNGSEPLDVDGEAFTTSVAGLVSGEVNLPSVFTVTQNRVFDPTGATVDIVFSEAVDQTTAETIGNWNVAGHVVQSATRLATTSIVRVVFDVYVLPGTDMLDVQNVEDLAGNAMAAAPSLPVTSTDSTAPAASASVAQAVEGAANDVVSITFNDDLIAAEITDLAHWSLQSPVGTSLPLAGASVLWNAAGRQATLTLPDGIDLVGGEIARTSFSGINDIAGNSISTAAVNATITAEINVPEVDTVWVETALANRLHVRFSEPCTDMDDLAGLTSYVVRTAGGVVKGLPATATEDADHLGVELVFGFAVVAGSDTLDVSGVTDLAGNSIFPVLQHAVAVEDSNPVGFDDPSSDLVTVSGERNDQIVLVFTAQPSRWSLLSPSNYTISLLGTPIDLTYARFSFDGLFTVTIDLDSPSCPDLQTGGVYDVDIAALNSAQGVAGSPMSAPVVCTGDSTSPDLPVGLTRIDAANPVDSVLIQFSEAVDLTSAENVANYDLNGGPNPDTVTRVGLNTVRATWSGGVVVSDTVNAFITDLAGNIGFDSRVVTAQDVQGPLVVSVDALSVANAGLDTVTVEFDKPVDPSTGLDPSNYGVTNGSSLVLSAALLSFDSTSNTVTIHLPAGVELDPSQGLNVHVEDVEDHAGLAMFPAANVGGSVNGDTTAPSFEAAFANYREDAAGLAIDVRFSEDVDAGFAATLTNWSASGGQTVDAVTMLTPNYFRLTLSAALTTGQTLGLTALPDMAGNLSGAIVVAPIL